MRAHLRLSLFAVALLSACQDEHTPRPGPTPAALGAPCDQDSDCASKHCDPCAILSSTCVEGCESDEECGEGGLCDDAGLHILCTGKPVPRCVKGRCRDDAQCGQGERCHYEVFEGLGKCKPRVDCGSAPTGLAPENAVCALTHSGSCEFASSSYANLACCPVVGRAYDRAAGCTLPGPERVVWCVAVSAKTGCPAPAPPVCYCDKASFTTVFASQAPDLADLDWQGISPCDESAATSPVCSSP